MEVDTGAEVSICKSWGAYYEQTTLTSILRALMFLKYSTLYTCIKVIYYIQKVN